MDDDTGGGGLYPMLTYAGFPELYFVLKEAGYTTLHSVLYLDEVDVAEVGVTDPGLQRRLLSALSRFAAQSHAPSPRDRMWRARRLVACMAAYLDATSLMRLRCVSKACKDVVQRGTTHVVLDRSADPGTVLILGRLRGITACRLGTVGSSRLCAALMSLPAAEVGMGRRLLSLDMTGCGMLDVGLMELSKVAVAGVLTRLEHLFLDGNQLQNIRPAVKAGCLASLPNLQTLSLAGNAIGDHGVEALCAALMSGSNPVLQTLVLQSVQVGDVGFCSIDAALHSRFCAKLHSLDLRWNQSLTDATARRVHRALQLRVCPGLRELRLRGTRFRASDIKAKIIAAGLAHEVDVSV